MASDPSDEFLQIFLDEARDILADWERHCLKLQAEFSTAVIDALFRSAHNLKGSARSVGLAAFAKFIHIAEDVITLVRGGKRAFSDEIAKALLAAHSALVSWRDRLVDEPSYVPGSELAPIEALLLTFHQEGGEAEVQGQEVVVFDEPPPLPPKPEPPPVSRQIPVKTAGKDPARKKKSEARESVRVPAVKIDALMQLVGELVTQQATIAHGLKTDTLNQTICRNAITIAHKLTRELQLQTMSLRLHSIAQLFQRLERTVRDLALATGKKVHVELLGTDVEVEKGVLDRISDALVHIVRNAVDHGIEKPGERGSKPPVGTVKIAAAKDLSGVTVTIEEDGRGVDRAAVLKKGKSLGLVPEGRELSGEEIDALLFAPGFSTAKEITEISGRGVGLDVVRRSIDEIGGSVTMTSRQGVGTIFTISLPVSVSIVESIVVSVDKQLYVVPLQEVSEVIDVGAYKPEIKKDATETIALREQAVTVRHLSSFLSPRGRGQADKAGLSGETSRPAIIVSSSGRQVALTFDELHGQQPIVVRELADYLEGIPGFTGSAILPNGEPAVILSPRIFARAFISEMEAA